MELHKCITCILKAISFTCLRTQRKIEGCLIFHQFKKHSDSICQWTLSKSADLLSLSLKWIWAAVLMLCFYSSTNVPQQWKKSALSLRCKSALTGLLRWLCVHSNAQRTVCLAVHTATKLIQQASTNQDAPKVTGPGLVFLCSLSLWLLHLFCFPGRKNLEVEGARSDRDGERERNKHFVHSEHPVPLALVIYSL